MQQRHNGQEQEEMKMQWSFKKYHVLGFILKKVGAQC